MSNVREWLDSVGLGQYADAFVKGDIDWEVLPQLDHEVLKELGVSSPGHRLRILKAAGALEKSADAASTLRPRPSAPDATSMPSGEAERRQLTVMFCDLVGSTALSESMDPEDYRELLAAYQSAAQKSIAQFGGYIARYMGDGLLVYFGYPQAHEDDPERAVRAALNVVDAIAALTIRDDTELKVRIGIATGVVVAGDIVGEGASEERAVLGDTPNLAARLQGIASPNTIIIAEATRRLSEGGIETEPLGAQTLKGISTPTLAFRVIGVCDTSRFDAVRARGLSPFVGRDEDLEMLSRRWVLARRGEGQVVLLQGEPGIGKSRIIEALCDRVRDEAHVLLRYQCSPYHVNSALYPVTAQLEKAAGFGHDDDASVRRERLEKFLAATAATDPLALPLIAALLSMPTQGDQPVDMSPPKRRAETVAVLVRMLKGQAQQAPLLMVMEDAHWMDPSTIEFVDAVVELAKSTSLLLVMSHRPEFESRWSGHPHVSHHSLSRLGSEDAEAIIAQLAGGKAMPSVVVEQIIAKTDGVALFVEELTKTVLESGSLQEQSDRYVLATTLPALAVPSTLQDSLMARLDRLSSVKEVAQTAAVLGREFSRELLTQILPLDKPGLDAALGRLVDAGLLNPPGPVTGSIYQFKHALVRDAAYTSLLNASRRQLHAKVVHALERNHRASVENQPELLAYHYEEAGLPNRAVAYWQRAGQRALERSANLEAEAHLRHGLRNLASLPETPERAEQELKMQTTLGPALVATKGFASPEVLEVYVRARELCQQTGEKREVFQVLRGLWYVYLIRSELETALELGEELLGLAEQVEDPVLRVEAHYALGLTLNYLAKFHEAHTHLASGIALYDSQAHRTHTLRYGQDAGVACRAYGAANLWWLGLSEQALQWSHEAVALARELKHPFSLGFALFITSWVPHFRREGSSTKERAESAISHAAEHGFAMFAGGAAIFRGWAVAKQSGRHGAQSVELDEGISEMHRGLATWRATGAEALRPYYLGLIAEATGRRGEVNEGLVLLEEALSVSKETGECRWDAELHRLRGELLLAALEGKSTPEVTGNAETSFEKALKIARRQEAKALELRAAMSLARLWQRQGKYIDARQLLSPIYDSFTEGLDTADLQEADALLEVLKS